MFRTGGWWLAALLVGCDSDPKETGHSPCQDPVLWYSDHDGDGYGHEAALVHEGCEGPEGAVPDIGDCDDGDATIHPGAAEQCNGIDQDCDGTADNDATDATSWYDDADGDGYGTGSPVLVACDGEPGVVDNADDCDDGDDDVWPGQLEVCNGIDDDCNGTPDDSEVPAYVDGDGDGFGSEEADDGACAKAQGYASAGGDCDDEAAEVYPGATEVCGNGTIEDCSLTEEEATAACATVDWADATATWSAGPDEWFAGLAMDDVGDLDGDGYDDTLLGSPWAEPYGRANQGAVWLMRGNASGTTSLDGAAPLVTGATEDRYVGASVAALGSLGGSTAYAVGAPTTYWEPGLVYVIEGTASLAQAALTLSGPGSREAFGYLVVAAGDVGGEGSPDLLVSAPETEGGTGAAYVVPADIRGEHDAEGTASTRFETHDPDDLFATSAVTGDLDGDGLPEVVLGAFGADQVMVFTNPLPPVATRADADATWTGTDETYAGIALATLDADDDGDVDLVVGAPQAAGLSGEVYVLTDASGGDGSLTTAEALITGNTDGLIGGDLDTPGDVDGLGTEELLIGVGYAYLRDYSIATRPGAGKAYLYDTPLSGSLTDADARITVVGDDDFGMRVSAAGDVDGDGGADIFVSTLRSESTTYLFTGPWSY